MEYTYTILHTPTGKMYHGCKYNKHADPTQLLNPNHKYPYYTSSKVVHKLIEETGINSFVILDIKIHNTGDAIRHEKEFLLKVLVEEPDKWLNITTNCSTHTEELFKKRMIEKYGVEHNMQLDFVKEKIKQTCLKKYGVANPLLTEKAKNTIYEKYNVKNVYQSEVIKQKIKQIHLEKRGVENPSQCKLIIEKKKETCKKKHGDHITCPLQAPEIKQKIKENWLAKYGIEWPNQPEEMRKRKRKPKSEMGKKNMSDSHKKRPIGKCPHCSKEGKLFRLKPYHFDNCKYKG